MQIEQSGDSIWLRVKEQNEKLYPMLQEWSRQAVLLSWREIDQSTYDQWRNGFDADEASREV